MALVCLSNQPISHSDWQYSQMQQHPHNQAPKNSYSKQAALDEILKLKNKHDSDQTLFLGEENMHFHKPGLMQKKKLSIKS